MIARQVLGARGEMRHVAEFDYVIINEDLPTALEDLVAVVRASRLRYANQEARKPEFSITWNRIDMAALPLMIV